MGEQPVLDGQEAGVVASSINVSIPDIASFDSLDDFLAHQPREQQQNIGGVDIASFASLDDFLAQVPAQRQQQEERQLVLYNPPTDTDSQNQPYLPWDCPDSDHHLYLVPAPAMAVDLRCPSPSYYVVSLSLIRLSIYYQVWQMKY